MGVHGVVRGAYSSHILKNEYCVGVSLFRLESIVKTFRQEYEEVCVVLVNVLVSPSLSCECALGCVKERCT